MRYPESHKEGVRARILDAAAAILRKDGLSGLSIPQVMKKVGLTHGGFYNHFRDRDQLVKDALEAAGASTTPRTFGDETCSLDAVIDAYLSPEHLAHPEMGCILAALGTEATRQPVAIRRTFAENARGFFRRLDRKRDPASKSEAPSDASLVLGAQMVGAMVLARLVEDPQLAKRILDASRRASRG